MDINQIYFNSFVHKIISQDVINKTLNHCYLISGNDSFLIDNYAVNLSKEIFCNNGYSLNCSCLNCQKIDHSNMVDLITYPKGEKNLVVDDINEIVVDCYIKPIENLYKVYILKNFDLCTVQAQNKILKTLEEPPANVIFILTACNENNVLPTIRSRSKKLPVSSLSLDIIESYLNDLKISNAKILASMSGGNLTLANNLIKNKNATIVVDLVFDMLSGLRTSKDILRFSSQILSLKKDIPFFLDTLVAVIRDVAVSNSDLINFTDKKDKIIEFSKLYTKEMLSKIVSKINLVYNKMEFNCNTTGLIDQLLLDILEVKFLCQK